MAGVYRPKGYLAVPDFYLFNEQCEFWTTAGRQGTAEHMRAAFEELYTANEPVITSYTSSQGVRKIMFAMPMEQPLQLGDTTYTALAVSYDNAVLEKLLGSMVYEGQSDCYIVRSNGDVVLSTETKTEITEQMTNLFDYLQQTPVWISPTMTPWCRPCRRAARAACCTR